MLEFLQRKINTSNPINLFLDILLWIIIPFGLFLFVFMTIYSIPSNPAGSKVRKSTGFMSGIIKEFKDSFSKKINELWEEEETKGGDFNLLVLIKDWFSSLFNSKRISSIIFSITFMALAYLVYLLTNSIYFKNKFEYINLFYSKYFILGIPLCILVIIGSFFFRNKIFDFISKLNKSSDAKDDI